jgi:hypothetical protein
MNKKQLLKIKKAMHYEGHPEQKRVIKEIKRQYKNLSAKEKAQFLTEALSFFDKAKKL